MGIIIWGSNLLSTDNMGFFLCVWMRVGGEGVTFQVALIQIINSVAHLVKDL